MDFSDINKVASRKRVYTDAEKLREKMSRESSKIIKLRVSTFHTYPTRLNNYHAINFKE